MQDFINNIVIEGIVIDPPSQLQTNKSGIIASIMIWHTVATTEMVFRAISNNGFMKASMGKLERGSLVTFYGKALFLERKRDMKQPFIIVSVDNLRVLDVGLEFGIKLLEEADLEEVNEMHKAKLPWELDA